MARLGKLAGALAVLRGLKGAAKIVGGVPPVVTADSPRAAAEDIYERSQPRSGDVLPPLPPLAAVPPGPVVQPVEVVGGGGSVADSVASVAVATGVAPRDQVGQPVWEDGSGPLCVCGKRMATLTSYDDGSTLYRCSACSKRVRF